MARVFPPLRASSLDQRQLLLVVDDDKTLRRRRQAGQWK